MSSRYDALVVDLDGTLIQPEGTISKANLEAVQQARDAGIEIIIATGRSLVESMETLERIGHAGVVIAAGGAMLCDAATGRTLERHAMPDDLVRLVVGSLIRHDHKALLLKDADAVGYDYLAVGPSALDPASQWWFDVLPVRVEFVQTLDDDPHPQDTVRAGAVASGAELEALAGALREEIGPRGFLQHWPAVTESHVSGSATHLLEVFNPRVNKWTAAEAYCAERGIDARRVAAIGDGLNDVQMIAHAGLGVAMENAYPEVMEVADRVTASNRDDGVSLAIMNILQGVW